jgi:hypothetical protein
MSNFGGRSVFARIGLDTDSRSIRWQQRTAFDADNCAAAAATDAVGENSQPGVGARDPKDGARVVGDGGSLAGGEDGQIRAAAAEGLIAEEDAN